jgi:hypothetical protein
MDQKTLTALKGSIAKWQAIVDGTGVDHGSSNCPLCQLFRYSNDYNAGGNCEGCPVAEEVEDTCCDSTPYQEYATADDFDDKEAMATAAKKELEFLKSLLPKG